MTAAAALFVLSFVATGRGAAAPTGCPVAAPTAGAGLVDPFHVPPPAAAQLNADGKVLYRQGRWEEARQKYRAALASDPDFLAPSLNIACSFVRQERFAEALTEVLSLIDRGYLPWSHEILSAADLGALKIRPEGKSLREALDAKRLRWAQGLSDDVILIARVRAPLKLGDPAGGAGPRALVLGQRQEVFSWSPWTRRYRQLTSEDGRVLAVARSRDGRRISYLTAEKLIRDSDGKSAASSVLRGVVVNELDLGALVPLGRAAVEGDVRSVDIVNLGAGFLYRIERSAGVAMGQALVDNKLEVRTVPRAIRPSVTLTGAGVTARARAVTLEGRCAAAARDVPERAGTPAHVLVTGSARSPRAVTVGGPFGAGLYGLPLP